ncbi:hypothetical protein [uncultured Halomonas sp.]|uniref:hypothetical protein n=1 Tax=uncultured Halomonas sp. TaxID=173971 RepID=UPI00260E0536|nr:hypothetical protein [uncultured Halomonas sp.]
MTERDHKAELVSKTVKQGVLMARIDAKGIEGMYDPVSPGTWRKQVVDCASWGCPLHAVRAKQMKRDPEGESDD